MTTTIRCLALLAPCYLWSGCSDGAVRHEGQPSSAPQARAAQLSNAPADPLAKAAPRPVSERPSLEALTSTLPKRVDSIVDAPLVPAESAKQPLVQPPSDTQAEAEREPRALEPAEVQVDRFVLASGVAGREPVGESETFSTDDKEIYAFVQLANPDGAPYAFRVHWEPLSGPATPYGVELKVPTAARFRTWAWTRIKREPGSYRAVLRTLDGKEIASREFEILPGEEAPLHAPEPPAPFTP